MSNLSDALDRWETRDDTVKDTVLIMDAARRVANPDYEAATEITYDLRYIKDGDDWDDQIEDTTKRAVDAALGVIE